MQPNNLVALYGVTNVGKTTQIRALVSKCQALDIPCVSQKYPVYDLAPTGPLIRAAIKEGNPKGYSAGEIQALMAKNRFDFEPELTRLMQTNALVVTEMYTATGIAYGMGDGVDKTLLLALNERLLIPHIAVLLDGDRFLESVERGHRFEEDTAKTQHIREIHLEMAHEYGWHIVHANQHPQKVHIDIWEIIVRTFTL